MNINPETGMQEVSHASGRSPRFTLWVAFLVFSTITMGSSVQVKKVEAQSGEVSASSKYAVACSAVTFALTLMVVITHFVPGAAVMFVGTQIEGALCVVLLTFWTAVVAITTEASDMVVDMSRADENQVQSANLYYFSWAGFFTIVVLVVDYSRSVFGYDVVNDIRGRAPRLSLWSGMLAASLIVMGSSARVLKRDCNDPFSNEAMNMEYCGRTRYGIAIGVLGVVFSMFVAGMKIAAGGIPLTWEAGFAVLLAILDGFGVTYITGAAGPGRSIGNLYYFSWGSFLVSAVLIAKCYGEYSGHDEAATAGVEMQNGEQHKDGNNNNDIEVETFDEQL